MTITLSFFDLYNLNFKSFFIYLPNTEQQAEFRIAHNSSPIAEAVTPRYTISNSIGVDAGKFILSDENPNPASIAAIPKFNIN